MAPHSSTLAWKIPWMEEPGGLQSMGSLVSDTTEWLHFHFSLLCTGEGNGNPLQCSCLENPRDGGAWWAAIYGVAQSRTWLKWLSSNHWEAGVAVCGFILTTTMKEWNHQHFLMETYLRTEMTCLMTMEGNHSKNMDLDKLKPWSPGS